MSNRFQKTNRSAFWNFLLARHDMFAGTPVSRALPYYISIDPSDRCQLRCPTCPTGIENEARRNHSDELELFRDNRQKLTQERFGSLIDELGEYLFLVMFYNYGEPLLNPHLEDFIRQAKAYDIETELHTNLSLPLSDQRIDNLLNSGLDRLLASIDGFSQETYQKHRVGGDLKLVLNNLERLAQARDRLQVPVHISWGYLVFSFNEHELPAAQQYSDRLGVEFQRRDAFVDNADWLPSYRKTEQPWDVPLSARVKRDADKGWSPLPAIDKSRCASACGWHYGYSIVTGGARVAPCCAVARDSHDVGEIVPGEFNFADVWNNPILQSARASFAGIADSHSGFQETICTQCPYPQTLQNLYSVHDPKVVEQFRHTIADSDPVLWQAFDLFTRIRFGRPLDSGTPPDPRYLFVGNESRGETEAFVAFMEQHILTATESLDAP